MQWRKKRGITCKQQRRSAPSPCWARDPRAWRGRRGSRTWKFIFWKFCPKNILGGQTNFAFGMYLLQVEDLDIRHPDLLHQWHVHWDQGIFLFPELKNETENVNVNNKRHGFAGCLKPSIKSQSTTYISKRSKHQTVCPWFLTNVYCYW